MTTKTYRMMVSCIKKTVHWRPYCTLGQIQFLYVPSDLLSCLGTVHCERCELHTVGHLWFLWSSTWDVSNSTV